MFKILLHPLAAKFFQKVDKETGRRIKNKIKELKEFPKQRGKHMKYINSWKLRIGDYRAIYEINEKENNIVVLFIGHRDDIYDDFSKLF